MTNSVIQSIPIAKGIWARLEALPLPKTEDSILLRCLVQMLVIVGVIATDIAAGTYMSAWAIPLSIVGSIWSWRHRRKRNVMVKFLLAIGMLLVLFLFFGNLVANLNDTRLVLAELLIQLQVLHSFDLPRRKDLGYSMVIGLILIGVAGTVSQTLSFGPLLIIFLIIALPALILDYHSRLGLQLPNEIHWKQRKKLVNPEKLRQFAYLTVGIISLGLLVFVLMPRFSGYQLRSFPVDTPVDLRDQNFELGNSAIISPGLVQEGEEGEGTAQGNGNLPATGPGTMDMEYYYGFGNRMNQNLRGTMTKKLVMRIRSQAPGFWRMLAFDYYNGQGWEISREAKTTTIPRPHWSYRFSLPLSSELGETKDIVQTYSIVSDLPNIIPVLSEPRYLFFPTRQIAVDSEGSLRSPFYLIKGLTYTVISAVPYRDRTALGETSTIYPPEVSKYYLQVPSKTASKVRELAETLLEKSSKPLTSVYEKSLFLAQSIKQGYTIQDNLPFFEPDEDLVEAFLFRYQGGYPDHFASVLTIMLRSLGIPARLAVGFAPGQFNPFTGYYLVHNTDAHAVAEVYFPDAGWFSFDPIPGHELIPPSFEQDQRLSILKQLWRWVAGWLPSPVTAFLKNLFEFIFQHLSRFFMWFGRLFSGGIMGFLAATFSLVLFAFFTWLALSQWQSLRKRRRLAKLAPMERIYRQMLFLLQERGYPKHPAQTPLEYANNAQQHQQKFFADVIEEISAAYVGWRYGEKNPDLAYLSQRLRLLRSNKTKGESF